MTRVAALLGVRRPLREIISTVAGAVLLLAQAIAASAAEPVPDKTIVLTFDDAVKSQVTNVAPLLKQYGFGATFFITQRWMDDPAHFMSWEDAAALHMQGFEIGNHTWTHDDFGNPEAGARLGQELAQVDRELARVGVPKPVSFAWPGNSRGPEALAQLRAAGIKLARRGMQPEIKYGEVTPGPLYDPAAYDPLLIPTSGDAYPGWTLDHFKKVVERARDGKIVVLQFHGVPDEAHPWVNTPLELFQQYMAYLKDTGYRCIALRDVEPYLDRAHPPADPLAAQLASRADDAKPAIQFGHDDALPLPKTLVFAVTPDKLVDDADDWKALGADGFFLDGVVGDWTNNIWATDGDPTSTGPGDGTFQKVKRANEVCAKLGQVNFLKVAWSTPFNWFDDAVWPDHLDHFRQFAIFARDSGCKGVALDIEYINQQYVFDWPGYAGHNHGDVIDKIRERATAIAAAMYDEFPNMEFLVLPEGGFALGAQIQSAWVEEAARRNAPGGVHFFTENTYFAPSLQRVLAYGAGENRLLRGQLSAAARQYWTARCSFAAGVWPMGYDIQPNHDPKDTARELRENWAGSLMISAKYNWLYLDRYGEQLLQRGLAQYQGNMDFAMFAEVIRKREIAIGDDYIKVAKTVRAFENLDPRPVTGITAVPRFMVPQGLPSLELTSASLSDTEIQRNWVFALEYYQGVTRNLAMEFHPVRDWQIIGPFKSGEGLAGHNTAFPPEQGFDPSAEYDGAAGKVQWRPYRLADDQLGIDFKSLFSPGEQVTAYALTYVTSPEEQTVQLRFGSNDSGKVWVDGKLVDDFNRESWCMLDRDIVTVTLPKGVTPILCKATTGVGAWGITLRITDTNGDPARGLTFGYTPQRMDADDRTPLPKDLIFVRTAVDKQTLRTGESLVLSIQVWSVRSPRVNSGPLRSSKIEYPSTDGFTVEDLEPAQFVANQGAFAYNVIEQRKRLIPLRNGTLTIGKFHWEGIALIDRTSVTARDKMYYTFDTKPIEITVTPTK